MEGQAVKISWRARLPWFAVWVPVVLLLYTLVNGAGHVHLVYVVLGTYRPSQECDFVLRAAAFPCGPWGFLILPVLAIFAYVSWRLCPQWSSSVRWMVGMLCILLCGLFLLAQAVLLHPVGWRARMPCLFELRVCAGQLWKPHFCRPVLEPYNQDNPSPAWKARASDMAAFLNDGADTVRINAAYALGFLGVKSVTPQIVKLLDDAHPYARMNAIEALRQFGDKSKAPLIIKFLEDPDWDVRCTAVEALGDLGDKSVAPQIVRLLEDAKPGMRAGAARALGYLGEKSVVPHLAKRLGDADQDVRTEAARFIRTLSGEKWPNDDKLEASARAWWARDKP